MGVITMSVYEFKYLPPRPTLPSYFPKSDHIIVIINWTISDDKYLFFKCLLREPNPVSYQELS